MSTTAPLAAKRRSSHDDGATSAFLGPLLVVLALATLFPLGYAVYLSFFNWNWGSKFNFVGLANYVSILGSADYWASLARTAVFTVLAVGLEVVLGLVLALAVERAGRNIPWLRTVFIAPLMVSGIVVSLVWKAMLDPTLGVIPWLAAHVGVEGVNLLGDPTRALPTLVLIDAWWQTGFVFVILQAGLQALPTEPFEAAALDGAGYLRRVRYLTVPMLMPLILVVAGIRSIDCLKVFALSFGTTGGGPGQATEFTQMLAYRTAFTSHQMSSGMTMMVVFTLLIGAAVLIVLGARRLRSPHA